MHESESKRHVARERQVHHQFAGHQTERPTPAHGIRHRPRDDGAGESNRPGPAANAEAQIAIRFCATGQAVGGSAGGDRRAECRRRHQRRCRPAAATAGHDCAAGHEQSPLRSLPPKPKRTKIASPARTCARIGNSPCCLRSFSTRRRLFRQPLERQPPRRRRRVRQQSRLPRDRQLCSQGSVRDRFGNVISFLT